jgi:rSAM/selenodomain-associated transferase 1
MRALIILTRVPEAGKTKTRLIGEWTPQQVAKLHFCFLKDISSQLQALKLATHSENFGLFVSYYGDKKADFVSIFSKSFEFFPQQGEHLGEKMANSFQRLFLQGYKQLLLIGADTPQLKNQTFQDAFRALQDSDIVLGPTFDGGYYLIGMKSWIPEVFSADIGWGGKTVLEETLQKIKKKKVFLLPKEQDIDTRQDLENFVLLAKKRNNSENTLKYLSKIWKK